MPFGGLLTAAIGAAASIGGGLLQKSSDDGRNNLVTDWAQKLFNQSQLGLDKAGVPYQNAYEMFRWLQQNGGLTGDMNDVLTASKGAVEQVPGLFNNKTVDPQIQALMSSLGLNTGVLQQLMGNSGQTEDSRGILQRAMTPQDGQANVVDRGKQLLDAGGLSAFLASLKDVSSEILGTRGSTSDLGDALKIASGIAATGGQTDATQAGLSTLQDILTRGGGNGLTDTLAGRSMELAGIDPLLSMDQVRADARDQAGTATAQAARTAIARAQARGGDAAVATGLGNEHLADFADQAARNEASAVQNASSTQQGLQLQQVLEALKSANSAGTLANQRLSTATSGVGNLTGVEGDKVNQALAAIAGLTRTTTDRLSTGANLGLGAEGQATTNTALGGQLANSFTANNLAGLQSALAALGLENNSMTNSVNSLANLTSLTGNLWGNNQNLNQTQGRNTLDGLMQALGLQGNTANSGLSALLQATGGLSGIGQGYLGYGSNALGGIAGLIGSYSPSQIGNTIMNGGLGILSGGFGNWGKTGNNSNGGGLPSPGVATSPARP